MSMDLKRLLEAAVPQDAEWAGLRRVRTATRAYQAKDGKFDAALDAVEEGFMVEVLCQGQFGYAALAGPTPSALRDAAMRALTLARMAAPNALFRFSPEVRPPTVLRYETARQRRAALSADVLSHQAIALTEAMQISDKIVQAAAEIETRDIECELVSTTGAAVEQHFHLITFSLQAIARDGNVTQRRTANGPRGRTHQGGYERLDFEAGRRDAGLVAAGTAGAAGDVGAVGSGAAATGDPGSGCSLSGVRDAVLGVCELPEPKSRLSRPEGASPGAALSTWAWASAISATSASMVEPYSIGESSRLPICRSRSPRSPLSLRCCN